MSNNNVMKIWNKDEENQLIEEINNLVDINLIICTILYIFLNIGMRLYKYGLPP